ncbi:hypothetical protein ACO22_07325 [Paracoccidioides brasiliensis]|uniref:Annexin n=1 Tax=Paracoccidioides brasiliensis TaxID=121759 RepID=A0A1D2J540_PARBR|nr:hypothetical protein ACO22_07325 [Paracoccidioides brasiliensis]
MAAPNSHSSQPPPAQPGQHPPQPYGAPPSQSFPPQGAPGYGAPPPQQGQYPPYGQYPPQSPYPPQQGQQPLPGQYPPPGQYQYQQGHYGQYPPQPYPLQYQQPQGQYQHPPYGYPPHHQPPGYYPQQPPLHGYGAPPPSHVPPQQLYPAQFPNVGTPSIGYIPGQMAPGDASAEADDLRAAMKGFGTKQKVLINILTKADPLRIELIKDTFTKRTGRNLKEDIKSETSGNFENVLVALVNGPLLQDIYALRKALKGAGTDEAMLNDVLIGRSNADLNAIKQAYATEFKNRSLEADVQSDLSGDVKALFNIILTAARPEGNAPILQHELDQDVRNLNHAMAGLGTDEATVYRIFARRSDAQLRAISQQYKAQFHKDLEKEITSEFSGHLRSALLAMLRNALDRAARDAMALEEAMKGWGTKDVHLIERIVRIHWDGQRMQMAKAAYKRMYQVELAERVRGETSGDYRTTLLAILQ